MSKFRSLIHQGWMAKHHDNATLDNCPYPRNCLAAKEWETGWYKANKGEPWQEPRRKRKVVE